jgi:hypothetical protein
MEDDGRAFRRNLRKIKLPVFEQVQQEAFEHLTVALIGNDL